MGNNSRLSVSKKRKSRKQVARDLCKKQRIGSQRDSQRHENIIARDFSSLDDEVFLIEQDNNPKENFVPGGRRVVGIGHLLSALKNINDKIYGCAFSNINIINEKHLGFKSIFKYKCNMCGIVGTFSTEKENINIQVNELAVCGTIAKGAGYTQLAEFCAALDIPIERHICERKKTFVDITEKVALDEMLAAGAEERAIDAGEVDKDGVSQLQLIPHVFNGIYFRT
jgi:hypothetical protein